MYAYRLPAVGPMDAAEHPSMRRLLPAGPWQYSDHPAGGTLATWKGASVRLEDYAAGRETPDGLTYYAPKGEVSVGDLKRAAPPVSIDVELASGVIVPIGIAMASPRKLLFGIGAFSVGDFSTEYAQKIEELRTVWKDDGDVPLDSPLLFRATLLALQSCLRVTEEALTDLGWVSTSDFAPIVSAALGYDPKKALSAGNGNDSAPAASASPAQA